MKTKLTLFAVAIITLIAANPASAFFATMDSYQLSNLYEIMENPSSAGTYLNPVQSITDGAKYVGNVRTSEAGWGQIQIGANFWGQPFGGSAGDNMSLGDLGLGSLSGYDSFKFHFLNQNEHVWTYNLFFNVGYTDWGETDYYVQNTWTSIAAGSGATMMLDFSYAQVWGGAYSGDWVDLATIGDLNFDHISSMGFNIGGDMPVGPDDYTFETSVTSAPVIPEPTTLALFGLGLLGAGIVRRMRK